MPSPRQSDVDTNEADTVNAAVSSADQNANAVMERTAPAASAAPRMADLPAPPALRPAPPVAHPGAGMKPHAGLQRFLRQYGGRDGLFYMGHASVLCVFGGKKILFDPVILSKPYGDAWSFYPPQVQDPAVFEVDAVVVSHIHQDHYDLGYLKALNGRAKVVVVGGRPSFEADLRAHEIKNLHIVPPETVSEILDGVFMYGVLHESNGIDASAIVYNQGFCIYHGNDNYLQPASLQKFLQAGRRIDVACVPYAYIHWYPFLLDYGNEPPEVKQAECDRLVRLYLDDSLRATRILQPQVMIPFGANLLLDDGNAYSAMNLSVKTPLEFCDYAAQQAPDLADTVQPMLAGDFCGPATGGAVAVHISDAVDAQRYRALADVHLKALPARQAGADGQPLDKAAFIAALHAKLVGLDVRVDNTIRVQLSYQGQTLRVEIDCDAHVARWVDAFTDGVAYHQFTLDPIASGLWLNGRRFEEIIGTRRFTVRREPNTYNPAVLRIASTVI